MANVFTNAKKDLTTNGVTTVYTVPASTTGIVKSILVSEDSGNADSITLTLTDASSNVFSLYKTKAVSANETTELLSQPIVLQESEVIKGNSSHRKQVTYRAFCVTNKQGIIMAFKEEGSVEYIEVDGKKVPVVQCEAEITLRNTQTNYEYGSDKEAEDDINNPDTDTQREHITRSVKIKVAKMPSLGASSDKDE